MSEISFGYNRARCLSFGVCLSVRGHVWTLFETRRVRPQVSDVLGGVSREGDGRNRSKGAHFLHSLLENPVGGAVVERKGKTVNRAEL